MKVKIVRTVLVTLGICFCQHLLADEQGVEGSLVERQILLEKIECRGNSSISCDFIRKKLRLALNQQIVDAEVQNAKLRLSALSNFKSVDLHLEKGSERGKVILIVEVIEASSLLTEVSIGIEASSYALVNNSVYAEGLSETVLGRASYQNLVNAQKIVEITISDTNGRSHSVNSNQDNGSDGGASQFAGQLSYIDPDLFGSDRLFLATNAAHYRFTYSYDQSNSNLISDRLRYGGSDKVTEGDTLIGVHLGKYSYLFAKYAHFWSSYNFHSRFSNSATGAVTFYGETTFRDQGNYWSIGYGWDSEDDPYFPTRGSVLSAVVDWYPTPARCVDCTDAIWSVAYKKNWLVSEHSVLTLNVGGDPIGIGDRIHSLASGGSSSSIAIPGRPGGTSETLGLRYAYLMNHLDDQGNAHRSRWYVQLGTGPVELSSHGRIGGHPTVADLIVGVRFESSLFGMVDLYAMGSRYWLR